MHVAMLFLLQTYTAAVVPEDQHVRNLFAKTTVRQHSLEIIPEALAFKNYLSQKKVLCGIFKLKLEDSTLLA